MAEPVVETSAVDERPAPPRVVAALNGLVVRYLNRRRDLVAVDGLDLEVREGELVAILGPSGCGKTSIVRVLAGLVEPTAGTASVADRSPDEARRAGLIALVTQRATLLPHRTVEQNLRLPLQIARVHDEEAVAGALRMAELTAFRHAYPKELSGGMQQRVAVARAYVRRPRVMLLDEPFSALDEMRRERFNEEFCAMQREMNQTGVLITHSVEEAVFMADRVAVCTPRPARIAAMVDIPLGPRRDAALRVREDYFHLTNEVRRHLRAQDGA
jgi:NitT/TauT family transport system ATP-binding protein